MTTHSYFPFIFILVLNFRFAHFFNLTYIFISWPCEIPRPPQKRTAATGNMKRITRIGGRSLHRLTRGSGKELNLRPIAIQQDKKKMNAKPPPRLQGESHEWATLSEGDIIWLENKSKRSDLRWTTCSPVGSLPQNGGADEAKRAWNCRVCNNQISKQTVPSILEKYLAKHWRTTVPQAAGHNPSKKTTVHRTDRRYNSNKRRKESKKGQY